MNLNYQQDLLPAARKLLAHCILNEIEDRDAHCSLPENKSVDDVIWEIVHQHEIELACIMGWLIGRVEEHMGTSLFLLFYHMGINDDIRNNERANFIYRMAMQTFGEGISPQDFTDTADKLEKAETILGVVYDPPHIEDTPFRELLEEYLIYGKETNE